MILGIGVDLVDIRRITRLIEKFDRRFTNKVFTEDERARCDGRADRLASYARRFAAKEACVKALGTGIYRQGISWQDVMVTNDDKGAPSLSLRGQAAGQLKAMTPPGMAAQVLLSLSDEYPYAQAFVVIALAPAGKTGES